MKRAVAGLAVALGLLVGCAGATAPGQNVQDAGGVLSAIKYIHDTQRGVGCWIYAGGNGSISCLPDSQYKP